MCWRIHKNQECAQHKRTRFDANTTNGIHAADHRVYFAHDTHDTHDRITNKTNLRASGGVMGHDWAIVFDSRV